MADYRRFARENGARLCFSSITADFEVVAKEQFDSAFMRALFAYGHEAGARRDCQAR